MTCSCSGAIEMSLAVLANPGQNVLCPTPGFGLYKCHLASKGVETRFYKLLVREKLEVDTACCTRVENHKACPA